MNKDVVMKYQSSANLFKFCRKVLDFKFDGIRVIDQDIGHILGYDPADCSHWKKGKKNVKSIQAMKNIAKHLDVDENLIIDVANGNMNDQEAFYEFKGYGELFLQQTLVEKIKKDFYTSIAGGWSKDKDNEFKQFVDIDIAEFKNIVEEIFTKINFQTTPLFLPELVAYYPAIKLNSIEVPTDQKDSLFSVSWQKDNLIITYNRNHEIKPFIRFRIAKAMAQYFMPSVSSKIASLNKYQDEIYDVKCNIFASMLLVPATMVKKEISNVNPTKDIVSQLAETFWVSKIFMNKRLKFILEEE